MGQTKGWSNFATIVMVTATVFVMTLLHSANDIAQPSFFPRPAPAAAIGHPLPLPSRHQFGQQRRVTNNTRLWVSMGLCFSGNTQLWGKKDYPYSEVLPLAVLLWLHFYPPTVKVILYLIRSRGELEVRARRYEEMLRQIAKGREDRLLIRWMTDGDMSCVLKSQTVRMWAFDDPAVSDDDLVMTIDANAFVYNASSLDPVYQNPDKLVWVFQYEDTAWIRTGVGETFNQNFIVAYADVWRTIVAPERTASKDLSQEWIDRSVQEIGLTHEDESKWYYDQWITTFGILKNGLCTAPEYSGLWNVPGLKALGINHASFNDLDSCWHGRHYKDCNRNIHIQPYGCKWWHFYPFEKFPAHLAKFHELTNNTYSFNLTTITGEAVKL